MTFSLLNLPQTLRSRGLKFTFTAALGLLVSSTFLGACSDGEVNCDDQRTGAFAVDILRTSDDCNYSGYVELKDSMNKEELTCEVEGSQCHCRGGTEFGVYEIYLTNNETNETVRAEQEVEAAPSPICISRDTVSSFMPVEGMGGAGGNDNDNGGLELGGFGGTP